MRKILLAILLCAAGLSMTSGAFAAGKGASGAGGGHSAVNSNGLKSADRDKGLQRAADRRNSHSVTKKHSKKSTKGDVVKHAAK